jgi:hypothetical protein
MKPRNRKPALIVDENGKRRHPLVFLAQRMPMKDIGKLLGHGNHSTASIYVARARKAPTTVIPAEWCLAVAKALAVAPAALRPDLYLPNWTVDNGNWPE